MVKNGPSKCPRVRVVWNIVIMGIFFVLFCIPFRLEIEITCRGRNAAMVLCHCYIEHYSFLYLRICCPILHKYRFGFCKYWFYTYYSKTVEWQDCWFGRQEQKRCSVVCISSFVSFIFGTIFLNWFGLFFFLLGWYNSFLSLYLHSPGINMTNYAKYSSVMQWTLNLC